MASTKFLAKLASEAAKPDGLLHVPASDQLEFLHSLPARSLWGVGPATMAGLERLGVRTIGDLAGISVAALGAAVGQSTARHLSDLAHGRDRRAVEPDSAAKSLSVENTFPADLVSVEEVESALLGQAQRLSVRLRRAALVARTVGLKIRYGDFTTLTRARSFDSPISAGRGLYKAGIELLREVGDLKPVRLLGLKASSLSPGGGPRQVGLDVDEDWEKLEDAMADVRDRFGTKAVTQARLLAAPEPDGGDGS